MWQSVDKARPVSPSAAYWLALALLMVLAAGLRLTFFNGPLGSDDVVYLNRALDVSDGIWSSANYNGALRYGYNIPEGILIGLFGLNENIANLWPLLCSLIEIAAVFTFAWHLMGRNAAWLAAIVLIFMPLHVAVATRLHADPVVSMFLTLSFVLFYFAEVRANRWLYFLSGISLGGVFWTKELAALAILAFAFYPIYVRRLDNRWLYLVGGGILMLLGHLALMSIIAGDPLHAFKVVLGQVQRGFIASGQGDDSPFYYFRYLLFDIKHTWLAPWLALTAIVFLWLKRTLIKERQSVQYVIFWLGALLVMLSFFPVSIHPLRFAMKQSNYITLFIAPIALLAGWGLSRLRPPQVIFFVSIMAIGGFVLAGMEQQAYQVFTSNSKAVLNFAERHPGATIYGSVNNANISRFYEQIKQHPVGYYRVHAFGTYSKKTTLGDAESVFAVIDSETLGWSANDQKIGAIPPCWRQVERIDPVGFGHGKTVLQGLIRLSEMLPQALGSKLSGKFREIEKPKIGVVYAVGGGDVWCK